MNPLYQPVFDKYNETLKPLMAEMEARLHHFAEPILPKIAEAFDYIALADVQDETTEGRMAYVSAAEGLMDECISLSYQYIVYDIQRIIDDFEEKVDLQERDSLSNGQFIGDYERCKRSAEDALDEADTKLLIESVPFMATAYNRYRVIEDMINTQYSGITMAIHQKVSKQRVLSEHIVGIIISVVVGLVLGVLLDIVV